MSSSFRKKNALKRFLTGAPPRTPLRELTTLSGPLVGCIHARMPEACVVGLQRFNILFYVLQQFKNTNYVAVRCVPSS